MTEDPTKDRAAEIARYGEAPAAAGASPCKWWGVSANGYAACSTCGEGYDERSDPRPACPRALAAGASPVIEAGRMTWRPLGEAPMDGTIVVLADDSDGIALGAWNKLEQDGWLDREFFDRIEFTPTKWSPVPDDDAPTQAALTSADATRAAPRLELERFEPDCGTDSVGRHNAYMRSVEAGGYVRWADLPRSLTSADAATIRAPASQTPEPTQRIYLDLDGVMADFDAHFPATFGLNHRDMADDAMWETINAHPSYFRDMPPMAGAVEFFRSIEHLRPIILTACPKSNYPHVAKQKREWVREHLSRHVTVLPVMGGRHKPLFMQEPGDILIDDWRKNIEAWEAAGGVGILHRSFDATYAALIRALPSAPQAADGGAGARIDHEFKAHPSVFFELKSGAKTFEFRRDDRGGFHVGQMIRVRCYTAGHGYADEPPLDRRITNILRPGEFGLQDGFCILSLASPATAQAEVARLTAENERFRAACAAVSKSIRRFPGSVHDRAMAKIDKAMGETACAYVDPDEEAIARLTAERDEARVTVETILTERTILQRRLATVRAEYTDARAELASLRAAPTDRVREALDEARATIASTQAAIDPEGESVAWEGCQASLERIDAALAPDAAPARRFTLGDLVQKTKGAAWRGTVVGFYSTALTPVGYAVESLNEPGSVQIYPEAALAPQSGEVA